MERLDFKEMTKYSAVEACIHLNRYMIAKPFCENKRILDVASGEGYGSYLLKKWGAKKVIGIDVDEETVKTADSIFASEGVEFQCHTAEKLPFPDYYFDMIVSFETIEHLEHPENFLKEVKRTLKPGGIIIISCPNDPYYYPDENESNPFHKKKYSYFEFKELAEKYLGNNVDYFLAFAVDGFLNMPISRSTEPSDASEPNMLEMLNYVECSDALCVKQERYLNHWNSNYYVGIWGGNEVRKNINAVIYPRETFRELHDEDKELLKQICNWKNKQNFRDAELEQKYHTEILKNERFSAMIELLNKENEVLRQQYDMACSEKNDDLIKEFSLINGELEGIKRSKGWKILQMLYKIEGIFRR